MTFDEANDALWGNNEEEHFKAIDAFGVEYYDEILCRRCDNYGICNYRKEDLCRFPVKRCNFFQNRIVGKNEI